MKHILLTSGLLLLGACASETGAPPSPAAAPASAPTGAPALAPGEAAPLPEAATQQTSEDEAYCDQQARAVIDRDSNIDTDIEGGPEFEETNRQIGDPTMEAFGAEQRFEDIVEECLRARGVTAPAATPAPDDGAPTEQDMAPAGVETPPVGVVTP